MTEENDKNNPMIAFNFLCAKKRKYILPMFQNIIQSMIKSFSFHDFECRRMVLSCCKILSA